MTSIKHRLHHLPARLRHRFTYLLRRSAHLPRVGAKSILNRTSSDQGGYVMFRIRMNHRSGQLRW